MIGVLFAERTSARLLIGWVLGGSVSALGVWLSYWADLPSGPVIVVTLGLALLVAGLLRYLLDQDSLGLGLLRVSLGALVVAGLMLGSWKLRKVEEHDLSHVIAEGSAAERVETLFSLGTDLELWRQAEPGLAQLIKDGKLETKLALLSAIELANRKQQLGLVHELLVDADDIVRDEALGVLVTLDLPASVDAIVRAAEKEPDEFLRIEMAEVLLEAKDLRGVPILLEILDTGEAKMARQDACVHLHAHIPITETYHADLDYEGHAREMAEYRAWWAEHGPQAAD